MAPNENVAGADFSGVGAGLEAAPKLKVAAPVFLVVVSQLDDAVELKLKVAAGFSLAGAAAVDLAPNEKFAPPVADGFSPLVAPPNINGAGVFVPPLVPNPLNPPVDAGVFTSAVDFVPKPPKLAAGGLLNDDVDVLLSLDDVTAPNEKPAVDGAVDDLLDDVVADLISN